MLVSLLFKSLYFLLEIDSASNLITKAQVMEVIKGLNVSFNILKISKLNFLIF